MKIYLIPIWLSGGNKDSLSAQTPSIIRQCRFFLVENIRTARRFISALQLGVVIDELTFFELNKHTTRTSLKEYFNQIPKDAQVGIMSEAGCPGIADPGAMAVDFAHQKGWQVVPLVGASSILMALMASGFNGQNFAFHGYLPIDKQARVKKIKELEAESKKLGRSQLFMETPYRNDKFLQDILKTVRPNTKICIASNLTSKDELVQTKSAAEWKKNIPQLHKKPTMFVMYAST